MNTGDWIGAVLNLVQIAAIIIGAAWAYYKFFRGRIFHRRAEPTVEGTLLTTGSSQTIRAKVDVENTGSADIPLRVALLTVAAYWAGDVDENGHPVWRDVARAHAFRNDEGEPDHVDIESQETITDDVVIPIPSSASGGTVAAYRITCQVYERRKGGGGICWTTKALVPASQVSGAVRHDPAEVEGVYLHDLEAAADLALDPSYEQLPNEPHHPEDDLGRRVGQRPAGEAEIEEAEKEGRP